jgi:hypothetical protein
MHNSNSNCQSKCLPGWEQYQSKEAQAKSMVDSLGYYNPAQFNPSGQEVSLEQRLTSKLDSRQEKEYGLAPVSPPTMVVMSSPSRRRK